MRKVTVPNTIPTEPEVLNKPRCLDLEFITEPTCITEMKAPDQGFTPGAGSPISLEQTGHKGQDSSHESILDPGLT